MATTPTTLTVVLADTHSTYVAAVYENERLPYRRRTVQIELTPKQRDLLSPRKVGVLQGKEVYEQIIDSWLETKEQS